MSLENIKTFWFDFEHTLYIKKITLYFFSIIPVQRCIYVLSTPPTFTKLKSKLTTSHIHAKKKTLYIFLDTPQHCI